MKNQVIIRDLKRSDLKPLEHILRKTWNYDQLFSAPAPARYLAKVYLASCLVNQTFSKVAEIDGVPVGVILGKNIRTHRAPLSYRLRQLIGLFQLAVFKEGRQALKLYQYVGDVDTRLLSQAGKDYHGEIALFAVSPNCRGLGIGGKLFATLTAYMKVENIPEFYLYTDTSCNFGFYEHAGMTRRQKLKKTIRMQGQQANMEFYLYDMTV